VALYQQLHAAKLAIKGAQIYGFAARKRSYPSSQADEGSEPIGNLRVRAIGTSRTFEAVTSEAGVFSFSRLRSKSPASE
jgi:hypothetical protein